MSTETPNPGGQPKQNAPGKPASRQPTEDNVVEDQNMDRDEGQEIPKTGRDPSEPLEQDVADDIPTDDDDDDEDQTGTIELPGDGGEGSGDRRDRSRPAGNP